VTTETLRRHPGRRVVAPGVVVGGALVAGCVALRFVDPAGGPTICPFKAWTGLDCPGCGATRALHQLLNGHLVTALSLNAPFVVAVPFVVWWFVARVAGRFDHTIRAPSLTPSVVRVLIVVLLVFGVVRNLPMQPFAWLGTGT
jgi:hypothetical protein